MANGEDLLWDAVDKGTAFVPRLRRTAVTAGCAGLFVPVLWAYTDAVWAAWAVAAYVLVEIGYRVGERTPCLPRAGVGEGRAPGVPAAHPSADEQARPLVVTESGRPWPVRRQ